MPAQGQHFPESIAHSLQLYISGQSVMVALGLSSDDQPRGFTQPDQLIALETLSSCVCFIHKPLIVSAIQANIFCHHVTIN